MGLSDTQASNALGLRSKRPPVFPGRVPPRRAAFAGARRGSHAPRSNMRPVISVYDQRRPTMRTHFPCLSLAVLPEGGAFFTDARKGLRQFRVLCHQFLGNPLNCTRPHAMHSSDLVKAEVTLLERLDDCLSGLLIHFRPAQRLALSPSPRKTGIDPFPNHSPLKL